MKGVVIIADYPTSARIQRRYDLLKPVLDERLRRLWAAAEALAFGEGGVSAVAGVTGQSRTTIRAGIVELQTPESDLGRLTHEGRARKKGAGRKAAFERDATLEADLEGLLESSQDREGSVLDWSCKSIRRITEELVGLGHQVSYRTIGNQLHRMGYRFSPNEGYKKFSLLARRAQFRRISQLTAQFLDRGEPVAALAVEDQDRRQAVAPTSTNASLGVALLQYWWRDVGSRKFPDSQRILLLLDTASVPSGGGAAWAPLLSALAEETRSEIVVAHFPPGAWRWRHHVDRMSCALSLPGQTGEALVVELQILDAPRGEPARRDKPSPPAEFVGDLWNYRVQRQPGLALAK